MIHYILKLEHYLNKKLLKTVFSNLDNVIDIFSRLGMSSICNNYTPIYIYVTFINFIINNEFLIRWINESNPQAVHRIQNAFIEIF